MKKISQMFFFTFSISLIMTNNMAEVFFIIALIVWY